MTLSYFFAKGEHRQNSRDLTGSVYEEMPVLVFYDPELKDEQALLCETVFKLVE
jgi:hypothetical protein